MSAEESNTFVVLRAVSSHFDALGEIPISGIIRM